MFYGSLDAPETATQGSFATFYRGSTYLMKHDEPHLGQIERHVRAGAAWRRWGIFAAGVIVGLLFAIVLLAVTTPTSVLVGP